MIQFTSIDDFPQVFVTSDLHFSHKNICRGVSEWGEASIDQTRNFATLEEMNQTIVDGINSVVHEDDLLIHLGDWSFGGIHNIMGLRDQLRVKTIFGTVGNHDHHIPHRANPYMLVDHILYLRYKGRALFCQHYPTMSWHGMGRNSIHLYGHVHGSIEVSNHPASVYLNSLKAMDVGIDNAKNILGEYKPFNLEEDIFPIMEKRSSLSLIDHH